MKNENFFKKFSFFGKRKRTTNDIFKNEISKETQKETIPNQETEHKPKYKLYSHLIDIDVAFAN